MKLSFRYAIAAIVMAGALFLLSPTLMPEDVNLPGASRISLGLDLKGGVQLTLGVDTEKAVQSALINSGQVLRQKAREAGITVLGPRQMPGGVQELIIARANQVDAFLALAKKDAPQVVPGTPRTGSDGAVHLPYSFTPAFVKQTQDLAVDQVLRTISSRIDQFGVAEPDIRKQQGDRILIQLPGLTNVNRAVQLVEKSADLSFHLVRDDISQGYLPPGVAFYPMTGKHGEATNAKLALDSTPLLSGKEVADARPGFDNKNTSMVSLSFTPRGAALFEMATGEHVGKRLAIVLDGTIHSAPVIQEKIAGGTASISGQFTPEEAQDLAISLRSGSLAAPVHVLEQRTVGPALGEASITSGILAALIGTLAVMIIMPLRYGWSGMLANGMLLCTLSLLMGGMAALGATLTLPGIAGVVLTIGMAVDANVLIFERIREELALGLTPPKAIKAGFERANLSIVDSNLTTIIVAAILYQFGTGPVRGFAVTLTLGIIASMFSAIFLCRIAFDAWMKHTNGTRLSMHGPMDLRALSGYLSHFPFLKRVKHVGVLTLLLVMVAVSVGTWRGGLQYGVDFSGGVAAQVRFEHPVSDKQLIGALDPMHLEGLMTQQYGDNNSVWLLRFGLPDMPAQQLGEALLSHLQTVDDGGTVSLDRLETVGPKVGDDLRSSALEAIYYALLLITVYISGRFEQRWGTAALLAGALTATMIALQWMGVPTEGRILAALLLTLFLCWRFRLSFAAGAMASLIFDVTTTTSLLVILGQEIDLNIVAALLTIIGYSLNDTIVIYDRIRETLRRENPDSPRPLPEIIQEALGDTMSRTLLTAGTTLVAALALFLLGGPVIYGFALTMLIGVFMGTISSLFVAAPMLPLFGDTLSFKTAVTLGVFERPGEHGVV